jgi:hypothetical protein
MYLNSLEYELRWCWVHSFGIQLVINDSYTSTDIIENYRIFKSGTHFGRELATKSWKNHVFGFAMTLRTYVTMRQSISERVYVRFLIFLETLKFQLKSDNLHEYVHAFLCVSHKHNSLSIYRSEKRLEQKLLRKLKYRKAVLALN